MKPYGDEYFRNKRSQDSAASNGNGGSAKTAGGSNGRCAKPKRKPGATNRLSRHRVARVNR